MGHRQNKTKKSISSKLSKSTVVCSFSKAVLDGHENLAFAEQLKRTFLFLFALSTFKAYCRERNTSFYVQGLLHLAYATSVTIVFGTPFYINTNRNHHFQTVLYFMCSTQVLLGMGMLCIIRLQIFRCNSIDLINVFLQFIFSYNLKLLQ